MLRLCPRAVSLARYLPVLPRPEEAYMVSEPTEHEASVAQAYLLFEQLHVLCCTQSTLSDENLGIPFVPCHHHTRRDKAACTTGSEIDPL